MHTSDRLSDGDSRPRGGAWIWALLFWPPALLATGGAAFIALAEALLALTGGGVSPFLGLFAFLLAAGGNVGLMLAPIAIGRPDREPLRFATLMMLWIGGSLYAVLSLIGSLEALGVTDGLWFLNPAELTVAVAGSIGLLLLQVLGGWRVGKSAHSAGVADSVAAPEGAP